MALPARRSIFALYSVLLLIGSTMYAADPATVAKQISAATLDPSRAIAVSNATLQQSIAKITLSDGVLVPAVAADGSIHEIVFVGHGAIHADPPDAIEAQQVELFTAREVVDEAFDEAVFVAADPRLIDSLFSGRKPAADTATVHRATDVFTEWKGAPERQLLRVEPAVVAGVAGDPRATRYFLARMHSPRIGQLFFTLDPREDEPVILGQFVPWNATERERRRTERMLRRQQKRGHHLDESTALMGWTNYWIETVELDASSRRIENHSDFTPEKYVIDATVADDLTLKGKTQINAVAANEGARVVDLVLDSDLPINRIAMDGKDLFFMKNLYEIAVFLQSPAHRGDRIKLDVEYTGKIIDKDEKTYALRDPLLWFPMISSGERALFDVTFHWPNGLDLLAGGRRTDGGEAGGMMWEHRQLDTPTNQFTFELGHFRQETFQAGHVKVTVAFDPSVDLSKGQSSLRHDTWRNDSFAIEKKGLSPEAKQDIIDTVRESLLYFEQTYGPYPLDSLTVLNVTRNYSEAMLGYITLSTNQMADPGREIGDALRAEPDRRLVVAHEVAHQWWGFVVGTKSDRDGWMSESLASYSAIQFGRKKLDWANRIHRSITFGWQPTLGLITSAGASLEQVGPLVLGPRLDSSYATAFRRLVYDKGPLVLDMLSHLVGEQHFDKALKALVTDAAKHDSSTADLLQKVREASGSSIVTPFADRYIYGVGYPRIYYTTSTEQSPDGKWKLHIKGEQQRPYMFRYAITATPKGFDVESRPVELKDGSSLPMIVAMQVAIDNGAKDHSLTYASNNIELRGSTFDIPIDIPWQPKSVWLDRDREVLARFYSADHSSKLYYVNRGDDLFALGKLDEAAEAYRKTISSKDATEIVEELGFELGPEYKGLLLKVENDYYDAEAHFGLARVAAAKQQWDEARSETSRGRKAIVAELHAWIDDDASLLEEHIDLATGNADRAFTNLSKKLNDDYQSLSAEEWAIFAAAAKKSGHNAEFANALIEAHRRGVDTKVLE